MQLPKVIHESWKDCPAFETIEAIRTKLQPRTFCPLNPLDVFKAFRMNLDDVKVVILGQD